MQSRDNLPADDIVFLVSKVTLFVVTDALLALKDSLAANDAIYSPAGVWGFLGVFTAIFTKVINLIWLCYILLVTKGVVMDSGQFLFTVISETLDRELDRKRTLETKATALVRLWVFLITIFISIITFLINYNISTIRELMALNNSCSFPAIVFITTVGIFSVSHILYLMTGMTNSTLGITYKNETEFKQEDIERLMGSNISSLQLEVCESFNQSILDYRKSNKDAAKCIEKTIIAVNKALIVLLALPLVFILIII